MWELACYSTGNAFSSMTFFAFILRTLFSDLVSYTWFLVFFCSDRLWQNSNLNFEETFSPHVDKRHRSNNGRDDGEIQSCDHKSYNQKLRSCILLPFYESGTSCDLWISRSRYSSPGRYYKNAFLGESMKLGWALVFSSLFSERCFLFLLKSVHLWPWYRARQRRVWYERPRSRKADINIFLRGLMKFTVTVEQTYFVSPQEVTRESDVNLKVRNMNLAGLLKLHTNRKTGRQKQILELILPWSTSICIENHL